MTTKKNYIYEDREYGDVVRRRSKVDVQGREIPLSELDQPYLKNNEEDDTYQSYEEEYPDWTWPQFPDFPDPIPGPCGSDDGCGHVKIIRDYPEEIECNKEFWFRTTHEVHGCEPPTGEAALIGWSVSKGEIISQTVGMRWRSPEEPVAGYATITAYSPVGDCEDSVRVKMKCLDCCDAFTINGPYTHDWRYGWSGTIDPPCPGATIEAESISGVWSGIERVSDDGAFISITAYAAACGVYEITVTGPTDARTGECENPPSATFPIRLTFDSGTYFCEDDDVWDPWDPPDCTLEWPRCEAWVFPEDYVGPGYPDYTGCGEQFDGMPSPKDSVLKWTSAMGPDCLQQYYYSAVFGNCWGKCAPWRENFPPEFSVYCPLAEGAWNISAYRWQCD